MNFDCPKYRDRFLVQSSDGSHLVLLLPWYWPGVLAAASESRSVIRCAVKLAFSGRRLGFLCMLRSSDVVGIWPLCQSPLFCVHVPVVRVLADADAARIFEGVLGRFLAGLAEDIDTCDLGASCIGSCGH